MLLPRGRSLQPQATQRPPLDGAAIPRSTTTDAFLLLPRRRFDRNDDALVAVAVVADVAVVAAAAEAMTLAIINGIILIVSSTYCTARSMSGGMIE